MHRPLLVIVGAGALMSLSATVHATFHNMQIEQIIGGVNGDRSMQAIQLRTRGSLQTFVSAAKMVVYDAAGQNPIEVIDIDADLPNFQAGVRILLATANFPLDPAVTPDFIITNPIPASYLAAGSLTFEADDDGEVFWRVCWGGSAYTGSTAVSLTNDADGDVAPPFAGPLPSTSLQALRFNGPFNALSTNNAADYSVTTGAAVFMNNDGESGTVSPAPCQGDVNASGEVDVDDLIAVILSWGACSECAACEADIDGNCAVDVDDLIAVILNWGTCR